MLFYRYFHFRKLLNFVIDEHFPFINPDNPEKYLVSNKKSTPECTAFVLSK